MRLRHDRDHLGELRASQIQRMLRSCISLLVAHTPVVFTVFYVIAQVLVVWWSSQLPLLGA